MTLLELQDLIGRLYQDRDSRRSLDAGIDELDARIHRLPEALGNDDLSEQARHIADVLVGVTSVANKAGIDLEQALRFYVHGCPECGNNPCDCN